MFKVWPVAHSTISAHSTDRGIETAIMTVDRQLPRNKSTIRLVKIAAIVPSRATPVPPAESEGTQ